MTEQLKQAISLIKAGKKQEGGRLLNQVLKADPINEAAWLWAARIVGTSVSPCAWHFDGYGRFHPTSNGSKNGRFRLPLQIVRFLSFVLKSGHDCTKSPRPLFP